MDLDIAILPKKSLGLKLGRKIVGSAKGVKARFLVDGKRLQYHMSLFHIKAGAANFDKLVGKVKEVARGQEKFPVSVKDFSVQAGGVMSLEFKRSRPWEKLQARLAKACAPLRSGKVNWPYDRKPAGKEAAYLKKYGTPFLYPLMKPHFTMGRLKQGEPGQQILQKTGKVKFSFIADTLAVCKVNKDHQVIKVVKIFKLK